MTSNRPEFVAAVLGASKVGVVPVLLNPSWKAFEVDAAFELTGPRFGIADGDGVALLAERLGEDHTLDLDGDRAGAVIDRTNTLGPPKCEAEPGDDAVFVFSSGTTDRPKAVRHTHRSIVLGTAHWCLALGLGHDDRFQVATPPSHILGLLNLLAAMSAGATVRLHRRFDLDQELRYIQDERMTLEMAVAPIALAMAGHPRIEDYDLSSLRYVMWGATPVTASVAETVSARTGVRWLPAYGTSEVPVITANPVDDPVAWRLDSAGLPVGDVELRVTDLDDGTVLAPGDVGQIEVRSASAMAGYLPDEATADAFSDGWYRTGDVGWLEPEGWVHLTDRCKEMIKVSGFQVAPAEIEGVLHSHPAVVDCAVFGVPDERAGEMAVAAVALESGSDVGAGELQQLVADTLASYKRLGHVVFVDAIPRTPSGKVLRRTLREELAPSLATAGTAG
jgi:acyl-CoA synthetase (AMP-forming)/AMP-acid ligase II